MWGLNSATTTSRRTELERKKAREYERGAQPNDPGFEVLQRQTHSRRNVCSTFL